ncbi:Glutathione gamma-glutamylcysteinyltransferase 1 [Bulinus truncatus]|nr:Glutathione gamma-glutamylcysteinyltransferase 1 [Bulinus truncatus]
MHARNYDEMFIKKVYSAPMLTGKQQFLFFIVKMSVSSSSVAELPVLKPHSLQFYRRPLPATCIDFASGEGKTIFSEALATGHMNSFFKLSSQYRTQDEPAYCGLTSLVMALNVLEIDPGRVWKGPWRWYHEEMLDCCTSLQLARERGINMEQFICLARCNNLAVTAVAGSDIRSLEELRAEIKAATLREDVVFIASYSRKTLSQTGDGHFSPIAGYHEGRDLVLILDTARFKYPPHWVPLQTLHEAMKTIDPDTGKSRGYAVLSSAKNQPSLLLFRPSLAFTIEKDKCSAQIIRFAQDWAKYVDNLLMPVVSQKEIIQLAISSLQDIKCKHYLSLAFFGLTLPYKLNQDGDSFTVQCPQMAKGEDKVFCLIKNLITELESLETFKAVKEYFSKDTSTKAEFLSFIHTDGVSCNNESMQGSPTTSSFETSCCSADDNEKCKTYKRLRAEVVQKKSGHLSNSQMTCTNCEGMMTIGPEHAVTLFLHVWPHSSLTNSSAMSLSDHSDLQKREQSRALFSDSAVTQETLPLGLLLKKYVVSDFSNAGGRLLLNNQVQISLGDRWSSGVEHLTVDWKVPGSNLSENLGIFSGPGESPQVRPALNGYLTLNKAAGRCANHTTPSYAEVIETDEFYTSSAPMAR